MDKRHDKLVYQTERSKDVISEMKKEKEQVIESIKKLIAIIKERGQITKTELFSANLGWGRGIKFGPYRRALLSNPNIYDIIDPIPSYCWKND